MVSLLVRDLVFRIIFGKYPTCIGNIEYKLIEIFASSNNKNSKGIRVMAIGINTKIIHT